MLLIVLFIFAVMTATSRDGWDRIIDGAFTVATGVGVYYFRHHALSGWPWLSGWF